MCIPVGIEFRCNCDWTGWMPCGIQTCPMRSLFGGGPPPMPSHDKFKAAGLKVGLVRAYVQWAHESLAFLKFDSCCASACCNNALDHSAKVAEEPRKYYKAVKSHLEDCLPMYLYGPILPNSMRRTQTEFANLNINRPKLEAYKDQAAGGLELLDICEVAVEKSVLAKKLNVNPAELDPLLQYLNFRRAALEQPGRLSSRWKPKQALLDRFKESQQNLGPGLGDAQIGFGQIDIDEVSGYLQKILAGLEAARGHGMSAENPTGGTTGAQLPMGNVANAGVTASVTSNDAKKRYEKLYNWLSGLPDLNASLANFAMDHEKAEFVRQRQADLKKAQDRADTIYHGTRDEDHSASTARLRVMQDIQAKLDDLRSVALSSGPIATIPTSAGDNLGSSLRSNVAKEMQSAQTYSQKYAPSHAAPLGLQGFYPPRPAWDWIPGYNPALAPAAAPAPPPALAPFTAQPAQSSPITSAEAQAGYQRILDELRALGTLSLAMMTHQQQYQAIENYKRDLMTITIKCTELFSKVDLEDEATQYKREHAEETIRYSRRDIQAKEAKLKAVAPGAPPQGFGYGPGPGAPTAPTYPSQHPNIPGGGGYAPGGRQGGSHGGQNLYSSGYGPAPGTGRPGTATYGKGGSQEDVSGAGGSDEGFIKASNKSSKLPLPPDSTLSATLPARPKPYQSKPPRVAGSGNNSAYGSVESLTSAVSQSTAASKLRGDSQPVGSIQGGLVKKKTNQAPSTGYSSDSADSRASKPTSKKPDKKDKGEGGSLKKIFNSPKSPLRKKK